MTPEVGKSYKPIEGQTVGKVAMIDKEHNLVTWSANEGRIVHSIPWLRFCEYFEAAPEEVAAP